MSTSSHLLVMMRSGCVAVLVIGLSTPTWAFFAPHHSSQLGFGGKKARIDATAGPSPFEPEVRAWDEQKEKSQEMLFEDFQKMLETERGSMSSTQAKLIKKLAEVCNPVLTPQPQRRGFWKPYRNDEKQISDFFLEWLKYAPEPERPGFYDERWDYLANTKAGRKLTNEDEDFKKWFVRFLALRGEWINTKESAQVVPKWKNYTGSSEHPFNIQEFVAPDGGFQSFNQFFLRNFAKKNETAV